MEEIGWRLARHDHAGVACDMSVLTDGLILTLSHSHSLLWKLPLVFGFPL